MKIQLNGMKRFAALCLLLALLVAAVPVAQAESYSCYVSSSGGAHVYSDKGMTKNVTVLDQYSVVNVVASDNMVCAIYYDNGAKKGFCPPWTLRAIEGNCDKAKISEKTKVYQKPSTSSSSMTVAKGTEVNIVKQYDNGWALVEHGGIAAYVHHQYLTSDFEKNFAKTPEPTAAPEISVATVPATVTAASVKVYQSASTSGKYLGTMKRGTQCTVLAWSGAWAQIELDGNRGYCKVSALTPTAQLTKPTATPKPTAAPDLSKAVPAVVTASSVKVYQTPSTSAKSMGTMKRGTVCNVVDWNGNWAYVELDGRYGYCALSALTRLDQMNTPTPTPTPTPAPTATPDASKAVSGTVTADSVTVYKTPSASGEVMGTLKKGEQVVVLNWNDGWALLERNGQYGYCVLSALTRTDALATAAPTPEVTLSPTPSPSPTAAPDTSNAIPAKVTASSVKVYQKASTGSKCLGTLKKGNTCNVIQVSGGWAYIEKGGAYGYCKLSALTPATSQTTPAPTPTPDLSGAIPAVVTASSVKFYSIASTKGRYLGTLKKGDTCNVIKVSGGWAYVERQGAYAYCKLSALSPANLTTPAPTAAVTPTPTPNTSEAVTGIVIAESVKVYATASTSGRYMGTLKRGEQVNVLDWRDGWAYIEKGGAYGYCALSALVRADAMVTPAPTSNPLDGYVSETFSATVVDASARLYASASTSAESIALSMGTPVTVGAYNKEWAYVDISGRKGFVKVGSLNREVMTELKSGDSGDSVKLLENRLLALGYLNVTPDTKYNSDTESAVRAFQIACGITATGSADIHTLRVLFSGNAPANSVMSQTYKNGDKGDAVKYIQYRLYVLGYLNKTSSVDGSYGANTTTAVKLFQKNNGLTQSGTVDSATLSKLYSSGAVALQSGQTPGDVYNAPQVTPGNQQNNSTTISSSLASTQSTYSSGMSTAQKLEYVIYVGQNQLGKPYIYAQTGPNSFDCTGFTVYCFKKIGITLKRSAINQGYDETYTKVSSVSELRRGDLVFFNTVSDNDLSDHAGIYLGAGYFIHSSSGQGKVVVSSLTSGYYNRVFSWGRRVLN